MILLLSVVAEVPLLRWLVVALLMGWMLAGSRLGGIEEKLTAQVRVFFCLVLVFLVAFAVWGRMLDLPWPVLIGALFLIDGFANAIAALTDYWRLSMLGHAAGLMLCGFGFPLVSRGGWVPLLGLSLIVGSLLATGIMYWQVRREELKGERADPSLLP